MSLERLYEDLKRPPLGGLSIQDALEQWHYTDFAIHCARPHDFEETPDLAARLRGGMGQALKAMEATQKPYTKQKNIKAYDVLFSPLVTVGRDEVPHPFIIRVLSTANSLTLTLRLFGFAQFWANEAADALVAALEKGIALKQDGRVRVPLEISHIEKSKTSFIEARNQLSYAKIKFKSPFCLRHNETAVFSLEGVLKAVERRVHTLMPWQGFTVNALLPLVKFKSAQKDVLKIAWQRHSYNQGSHAIPMQGYVGECVLQGDLTPLAPWLLLAETANIGSHTSLGLGWFDMIGV